MVGIDNAKLSQTESGRIVPSGKIQKASQRVVCCYEKIVCVNWKGKIR